MKAAASSWCTRKNSMSSRQRRNPSINPLMPSPGRPKTVSTPHAINLFAKFSPTVSFTTRPPRLRTAAPFDLPRSSIDVTRRLPPSAIWVSMTRQHAMQGGPMAATNRGKNDMQRTKGKVKETAGRATGNKGLERKGKGDQMKGKAKNVGEKIKDKVRGR